MTLGRTLLIGAAESSWNEWIEEHLPGRPLVVLDPGDATRQPPARCILYQGDRPVDTVFIGSLSPQSAPHLILAACARLAQDPEAVVLTSAYHPQPLLRQTLRALAEVIQPERLLVPADSLVEDAGWTVGPERVELPKGLPKLVRDAQRKAQWLRMVERALPHEIPLADLSLHGIRLGSGTRIPKAVWEAAGLPPVLWAEACGPTLFVVSSEGIPEEHVPRALDFAHCDRLALAKPEDYEHRLCALCRDSGEEFGFGRLERIDFENEVIYAQADAIPPVPVRILKVGPLRVDANGVERGEDRPWLS